jgi:pyrroloquinoline quinone biosynthesis protein B
LFDRGNFSSASFASDTVIPIEVPHRARDFDTHALFFRGISNNLLFLPDHDTWGATLSSLEHDSPRAWFQSLDADIVLLDGTFWDDHELKNRVQTNVPHPPVSQSLELLGNREDGDPRIIFIHLNHTNPLHYPDSEQYQQVNEMGWEVGTEGMEFVL